MKPMIARTGTRRKRYILLRFATADTAINLPKKMNKRRRKGRIGGKGRKNRKEEQGRGEGLPIKYNGSPNFKEQDPLQISHELPPRAFDFSKAVQIYEEKMYNSHYKENEYKQSMTKQKRRKRKRRRRRRE